MAVSGIYRSASVPAQLQRPLSLGPTLDIARRRDMGLPDAYEQVRAISLTSLEGNVLKHYLSIEVESLAGAQSVLLEKKN